MMRTRARHNAPHTWPCRLPPRERELWRAEPSSVRERQHAGLNIDAAMRPQEPERISQGARPPGDVHAIVNDAVLRWLDGRCDYTIRGREGVAGRRGIGGRQIKKERAIPVRTRGGEAGGKRAITSTGKRTNLHEFTSALTRPSVDT
jgi:hypothetical protein